jgi:uncharacterized RDD family membrane protein YckC
MSDFSQGPGWWQASDGKWYPPEQAPGGQAAAGTPGMGAPTVGPGAFANAAPAGGAPLAEWIQRVVAWLIDGAFIFAFYIVIWVLALVFGAISDALGAIVFIVGYIAAVVYSFWIYYLNGATGQSPGKALTGLKVVSEADGSLIGGGMGIVRGLAHFLDSLVCGLGYFLPLFDAKKQTISDKVIKTVVLADQEKRPFGPDIFKP